MPFRTWLLIASLGLTFGAGLGQAQEQTEAPQGQADKQQEPAQPLPLPVVVVEDDAATDARRRREEEAQQREVEDLVAQKGMNAATQAIKSATNDMRDYALYSTVAVWVGTALLFYTLCLSRSANSAAHTAVRVTREVGERQVRAYVGVATGASSIADGQVIVETVVKNFGQTPAYNLVSRTMSGTVYSTSVESFLSEASEKLIPDIDQQKTIQPGQSFTITTRGAFSQAEMDDLFSGAQYLLFCGRLFYDDASGVRRETFWAQRLEDIGTQSERVYLYGKYNKAT